jgi:hypothetical protein
MFVCLLMYSSLSKEMVSRVQRGKTSEALTRRVKKLSTQTLS